MSDPAIQVRALHKSYRMGKVALHVLRGVSFSVQPGEFVAIVGTSGSGKSTLLHLLGLLDKPDRGRLHFNGRDVATLSGRTRNRMRCRDIGFVFQFYHLLPELNVLENVLLPRKVDSSTLGWVARRGSARRKARELLDKLGLAERLTHRPNELSGGERQRVAIARALINAPGLLLADEPTGNLDSHTGAKILEVLKQLHAEAGQTIVMVTHDVSLAQAAGRVLHLRDGKLKSK